MFVIVFVGLIELVRDIYRKEVYYKKYIKKNRGKEVLVIERKMLEKDGSIGFYIEFIK